MKKKTLVKIIIGIALVITAMITTHLIINGINVDGFLSNLHG